MDFLGLRNLTILAKAVDLIEQTTGERIDPYQFPMDDKETFALLCRGETKGIFQLESGGIRDLLQRMKPDSFSDIIATNALYRPGPLEGGMVDDYIEVKHGRQEPVYPHPVMKEVLEETHGVMVYQEQVMRILNRLGGIDLSSAYSCIKAISKKNLPAIAKFKEEFLAGATGQGLDEKRARELFEMIGKFAGYGFNKSHSTAYALIAYMTAYLKAHHPVEFMAALLSGDIPGRNFKKKDSLVEHLEDCRRMNIEVVPPDVNASDADFTVADGKIHFGLSAIKACGVGAAEAIRMVRQRDGEFRSLFDLCERVDSQACGRATIETLIKAGALDSLGAKRSQQMAVVERAMQSGASALADRRSGQKNLFGQDDAEEEDAGAVANLPKLPEWDDKEKLVSEKEVLGFYLTSHPLAQHQKTLAAYCTYSTTDLAKLTHRTEVMVGGMISAIKYSHTKNPRAGTTQTKYAMFDLEDTSGIVRSILWPEQFAAHGHLVEADHIVVVRGSVDRRPGSEEVNLIVNEVIPLEELRARYTSGVIVRIDEQKHGERGLEQLREILRGYPGKKMLRLRLALADGTGVELNCADRRVEPSSEMQRRVDELLGPGNLRLITEPPKPASGPPRGGYGRDRAMAGR